MYQKIRQYLNEKYLAWVILDSISQARLVSLISRLNIEYIGVRISSIHPQDLAYDLAKEAFVHKEIMDALIKILDKVNSEHTQGISQMADDEVKAWITDPNNVYLDRKIGRIIWGLLSDSREVINELIPRFLGTVEEAMKMEEYFVKQMDREAERIDSILSSKKGFKKLSESISLFKEEIAKEQKISADLMRKNKRLKEKNLEQQKLIQQLRKSYGELTQEKGMWHKQIAKKETETQSLYRQIKELKNQLVVGPKMRLKSEIHRLQKENSKLNYILEKEYRNNSAKISDLEKELLQLKDNLKELQQANLEMHQQLERERQGFKELQKEYQLISVKKEPLFPKPPKEKIKRLGVFIDNQNVYYSAKMHYGKKLD